MISKKYINEDNYFNESFEYYRNHKKQKRYKYFKKKGNKCYCLDMLEHFGPINIIKLPNCSKIYINKMELIKFNDHFDDLFEKGKRFKKSELKDENKKSIPNLTFWFQRYYYYSKYDDGIMMDNESNSITIY